MPAAQAKRLVWYQLPPRGFWVWACGGLSVFDAAVIIAWTALNIIYVWQRVAFIVPLFRGAPSKIQSCLLEICESVLCFLLPP